MKYFLQIFIKSFLIIQNLEIYILWLNMVKIMWNISSVNSILPVFYFLLKIILIVDIYFTLSEKRLHLKFRSLKGSASWRKNCFCIFCNLKDYILKGRTFERRLNSLADWSGFEVTISFSPPDITRKPWLMTVVHTIWSSNHKSFIFFCIFSFLFLNTFLWFCSRLAGRRYLSRNGMGDLI